MPVNSDVRLHVANRTTLSKRKYRQLALESLRNSLRLLRDAIALYENGSFPTAFQLAVLAMEEYAKAKWVDHVYDTSITNDGFGGEEFEQSWLRLLYLHPAKQEAFMWREYFEFHRRFLRPLPTEVWSERSKLRRTWAYLRRERRSM